MKLQSKKVALFIPTLNVEKSIAQVLAAIPKHLVSRFSEIMIIDNGSTDRTLEIAKNSRQLLALENLQIFQNRQNYSLGGSTVLAFERALSQNYDYLICMHSDGQADPVDLEKFVTAIEAEDYDYILGNRFDKNSKSHNYSRIRYFFNLLFCYLQMLAMRQKAYDLGAFIGFNLKTIRELPYAKISTDMGYHPLLILLSRKVLARPLKIAQFPIFWGKVESTNLNVFAYGLTHLSRILCIICGFSLTKNDAQPMHTVPLQ